MNRLQHLKTCKTYLRKIINYRRQLIRMGCGKKENSEMVKTIAEIDYNLGAITSFDQMMNYLGQRGVQTRITRQIIPKNKKAWKEELDWLVMQGDILQGRIVKQTELIFK